MVSKNWTLRQFEAELSEKVSKKLTEKANWRRVVTRGARMSDLPIPSRTSLSCRASAHIRCCHRGERWNVGVMIRHHHEPASTVRHSPGLLLEREKGLIAKRTVFRDAGARPGGAASEIMFRVCSGCSPFRCLVRSRRVCKHRSQS